MKNMLPLMKKISYYIGIGILLAACTADADETAMPQQGVLTLTSSVNPFVDGDGTAPTRTNIGGDAFAPGDRIKLKIICPYTDRNQFGETTWSNTADGLWLLKWSGSNWTELVYSDSVDMVAQYKYSGSYSLFSRYEAQQTPYVYTASTWNENVLFIAPNEAGKTATSYFSQYSYLFHADQTLQKDYLKCDLLWAQTYMQTGAYNIHLSFNHVMACLKVDISALTLSGEAVVTLENMPDIDMCEVVVGDYYAPKAKNQTHAGSNFDYSYRRKCSCQKKDNGKVLGIAVINDATAHADIYPMTGNPAATNSTGRYVANTGVYTAHRDGSHYYLIVPPCDLTDEAKKPTLWIRDGEKRYSCELQTVKFEQGKQYRIAVPAPVAATEPATNPTEP